jgi:hypothetical protein
MSVVVLLCVCVCALGGGVESTPSCGRKEARKREDELQ